MIYKDSYDLKTWENWNITFNVNIDLKKIINYN